MASGYRLPDVLSDGYSYAGDDAIAMHGFYYLVASADPSQQAVTLATNRAFTFAAGDLLTFYASNTSRLGTARIARMLSVDNPLPSGSESSQIKGFEYDDADFLQARTCVPWPALLAGGRLRAQLPGVSAAGSSLAAVPWHASKAPVPQQGPGPRRQARQNDGMRMHHMQVFLATWPEGMRDAGFDTVVTSPSNQGSGFAVLNNTIGNLRGRGVLTKSSNGIIAGASLDQAPRGRGHLLRVHALWRLATGC